MTMIERRRELPSRAMKLGAQAPDSPDIPKVPVRKDGIFGGAHPADRAAIDRLHEINGVLRATKFAKEGMRYLNELGHDLIVDSIERMEERDDELVPGTLAEEAARALRQIKAQQMAEADVALDRNFTRIAISRLQRD